MEYESFAKSQLRPLLGVATAMTGDHALAEDLVQEVLIKTQTQWSKVSGADNPDAYVRRMLVNEFVSWRRKWSRMAPRANISRAASIPDPAVDITERDAMRSRLLRLPRRQQVVLALRYYAGMTDTEIAQALNCAPGTVRGYASRALATLRADLSTDPTATEVSTH